MIKSIQHKGLRLLFEKGDRSKIRPDIAEKAGRFLDLLHYATEPQGVNAPGYRLHALTGDLKGFWSATLSRNHRIIFRFEGGNAYEVDLVDYH